MLATISIATLLTTNVVKSQWAYDEKGNNASHWGDFYAECGYSRQSPIDLPTNINTFGGCDEPLEVKWTSHLSHYAIQNTGKSLLAMPFKVGSGGVDISSLEVLHHTNDTDIRLQNSFYHTYESGVNKEYCFDSLHFHWGKTNDKGSEHTVNGESFPLEVHLVHYSCDYPIAGEAITDYATGQANIKYDDENVLAVIGVIFEIGKPNLVLNKILDDIIIDGIYERRSDSELDAAKLLQLYYTEFDVKGLLPESREIVAYLGSLTTPPCFETVRWHVLKEKMTVSEEQMEKFRMLLSSESMNDTQAPNFRPPLPLNDRTIYQCKEDIIPDALYDDIAAKDEYLASLNQEEEEEEESDLISVIDEDGSQSRVITASEVTWRMIGVAFICLFSVTFCLCIVVYVCAYRRWNEYDASSMSKKRRMSHQQFDGDEEAVEMGVHGHVGSGANKPKTGNPFNH